MSGGAMGTELTSLLDVGPAASEREHQTEEQPRDSAASDGEPVLSRAGGERHEAQHEERHHRDVEGVADAFDEPDGQGVHYRLYSSMRTSVNPPNWIPPMVALGCWITRSVPTTVSFAPRSASCSRLPLRITVRSNWLPSAGAVTVRRFFPSPQVNAGFFTTNVVTTVFPASSSASLSVMVSNFTRT